MARRPPVDVVLVLTTVPVVFLAAQRGTARAEGNNAAWACACADAVPLLGRCYYQFQDTCYTVCPSCARRYRVVGQRPAPGKGMKTIRVDEF
jgi:hypothetical protein